MAKENVPNQMESNGSSEQMPVRLKDGVDTTTLIYSINWTAYIEAVLNWTRIDEFTSEGYIDTLADMCHGWLNDVLNTLKMVVEDEDECERHVAIIEEMIDKENITEERRNMILDYNTHVYQAVSNEILRRTGEAE